MHPLHEQFAPARQRLAEQLGAHPTRYLLEQMAARELAQDQVLLTQGTATDALYFVLGGRLGVFVKTESGKTLRVSELGAGDWVGEVSFVDPGTASATVRAKEPTLVLEFRAHDLGILIDDAPDVASELLGRLCSELAHRVLAVGSSHLSASGDRLESERSGFFGLFARLRGRK